MGANILVIGGTYFAGRVFSLLAQDEGNQVTVMNRGHYSMKGTGIGELRCDRRDTAALQQLRQQPGMQDHYDAVVDFCAYEPDDIRRIFEHLPCRFDRYIYVSTPEVTKPSREMRNEESPVLDLQPQDQVGLYTWKKLQLESELVTAAHAAGTGYTIIRPAFIFGPYNYAPRESWYIQNIVQKGAVLHPVDATGKFNMVYVKDLARAILTCATDSRAINQTYVVSGPEVLDYDSFAGALKAAADRDFQLIPVQVADVIRQNLPLPFPLTEKENELFDGTKITRELGFRYTPFGPNLKKAYDAFREVYDRQV